MASSPPYIGQALPAKVIRVSATNLFRVAALQLGDPLAWWRVAEQNGLTDPWLTQPVTLAIPSGNQSSNGGITNG